MESAEQRLWRLRKRLAAATLCAAALITPTLWLVAGTLVGDTLMGVWVGTLAAFVMVAGPLAVPRKPVVSRVLVIGAVLIVGGAILWLSPSGPGTERTAEGASLIAFFVGALTAHASWAAQINRVSRNVEG